jgi:hypothetical protein
MFIKTINNGVNNKNIPATKRPLSLLQTQSKVFLNYISAVRCD